MKTESELQTFTLPSRYRVSGHLKHHDDLTNYYNSYTKTILLSSVCVSLCPSSSLGHVLVLYLEIEGVIIGQ